MSLWRTLLAPLAPRLCAACGGAAGAAEPLCAACRGGLLWLPDEQPGSAWAPVAYEGPARDVLHAFKFGGRAALADLLAAQIAARAPAGLMTGVLVPVPIHPRRLLGRGFNQAELLARSLARRTGLPLCRCLGRRGDPVPQAGRTRRARLAGVAGSVIVTAPVPARALLVDDVVTTGATLRACATALRSAGAGDVAAVAWARTPPR